MQVVLQSGLDDPLDKEEELQDQMENLPYLCRFQYEESCKYICGLLDPVVDAFSKCKADASYSLYLIHIVTPTIHAFSKCGCCP